jgi:hypothetical protein
VFYGARWQLVSTRESRSDMAAPLHVRRWNGINIPTPGQFEIDAQHTTVGFVARHLMVTQVRGRFEDIDATINVAEDSLLSHARATISTASITTGADDRDAHLKSADFLDVEKFPTMTYVSRAIRPADKGAEVEHRQRHHAPPAPRRQRCHGAR